MLPVAQAIENGGHYGLGELGDALGAVLEAVDKGGHGLEASYFAVDVVGFEVFVPEEGDDLVDLVEMALIRVLGNYYLDVAPRRFSLLLVSE